MQQVFSTAGGTREDTTAWVFLELTISPEPSEVCWSSVQSLLRLS